MTDRRGRPAQEPPAGGGAQEPPAGGGAQEPPAGGGSLHGSSDEGAPQEANRFEPPSASPSSSLRGEGAVEEQGPPSSAAPEPHSEQEERQRDYLDDLKRLQAEFDNYRKRMMRDNGAAGDRAAARVIEDLLPVLDNFERAIAHGEGGEGVQLVFKDLRAALEREGLEEVPAEGTAFDPNIHEAVESREVEGLAEPTIIEVYRRGYMHKGQLLRPAMVVVGRPTEIASR